MAANVYSLIEEKGFGDGLVFIALQDNTILNATIYGGIIISFKCPRLSFGQIVDALSKGTVKDISLQKSEIHLDTIQPEVIAQTFPAAVAASTLNPARTSLPRLLRAVRILDGLTRADKARGGKAFDIVSRLLSMLHPGFLLDNTTIKKRADRLEEEFNISTSFLADKPVPRDAYSVPQWVFTHFDALSTSPLKEVLLYFLFFGEVFEKVIRAVVEKEMSLGAKQGYALLSKAAYPALTDARSASIFNGAVKVGEIKIDWNSDRKNAVLFAKPDFDRLGLESGGTVNLILVG